MDWKLGLAALFLATIIRCAAIQDCTRFPVQTSSRCSCIRDNGDTERARVCSRELSKAYLEQNKQRCLQRCYGDNCNEKCEKENQ